MKLILVSIIEKKLYIFYGGGEGVWGLSRTPFPEKYQKMDDKMDDWMADKMVDKMHDKMDDKMDDWMVDKTDDKMVVKIAKHFLNV